MVGINKPNLAMEKGHKAGMEGLDEEKINKVMEEATKGSKFYAKKKADQARTSEQVMQMISTKMLLLFCNLFSSNQILFRAGEGAG